MESNEISEYTTMLGSVPLLLLFRGTPEERARRGTVLLYHGFGTSKETYRAALAQLAEAGLLAIGVDAVGHGERRYPNFDARFPPLSPELAGDPRLEAAFLNVVRQTVQEIPGLLDALIERQWAHAGRIGLAGHSFGGFVTYAAMIADKRISVAAPISGSPRWKLPRPDSPHLHLDRFFPTALFSQIGGQDTNTRPEDVSELHAQLIPYYTAHPQRLRCSVYPVASHDFSVEEWARAWSAAVEWFKMYLPG